MIYRRARRRLEYPGSYGSDILFTDASSDSTGGARVGGAALTQNNDSFFSKALRNIACKRYINN